MDLREAMSGRSSSNRMQSILQGLNEVQSRAATHKDGPLVVFAGAGSGKTRIITHRIAWLIETGVNPNEILAVTFTNKAAQEMRSRLDALTPYAGRCHIATFHAACARWLREFAPELGYTSDFTIYDDNDSLAAIKTVLNELNVKLSDEISATEYKNAIGRLKTMALLPGDERLRRDYLDMLPPAGVQVYERYQEYLAACNAMDFSDLIMNVLLLLRRNVMVRGLLQRRYRYILVDEYQDTNRTQFELISKLAEGHRNLFVVGDDDQSIYSWRGAVPSNIIDFDKIYADAVKITMEQNYRCTGHIVNAANAMVANNRHRVVKRLFTTNDPGERINYRLEADNEIEAWWVVDCLRAEKNRFDFSDVAVFYRTNSQSRVIEDALRRENIPYRIYGTVRFYDRMEIKDLIAYMRIIVNPADDVSLKRIINIPARGIGKKAIENLELEALKRGLPLMKTIETLVEENAPKLAPKLKGFCELYQKLRQELLDSSLDEALEHLLATTQYLDYVIKKFPEQVEDKTDNIHELGAALADFATDFPDGTISDWLQSITLASSETGGSSGVSLMTLHMAKGLEFRRVFIVGMEEALLPHRNSLDNAEGLEEERRLFYVGMTRAKEKLSLVGAYKRRTYNSWSANKPSRFLNEIPREHFEPATEIESSFLASSSLGSLGYAAPEVSYDYSEAEPQASKVMAGSTVSHPTYGKGVVESLHEEFGLAKAIVRFHDFGMRKVVLRHLTTLG